MSHDQLTDDLRQLGRTLPFAPVDPDELAERVMADVTRVGSRADVVPAVRRRRLRPALAFVTGLLIVLALTPPVRATVVDWFGVIVRSGTPAEEASVPGVEPALTLERAADRAGFDPIVPSVLGRPDGIDVMSDGRVVSMSWSAGGETIRLDQFEGMLAPVFAKQATAEPIEIGDRMAVWFDGPHVLTALDEYGLDYPGSARSAGPTLVWEHAGITLRVEGADRSEAIRIAGQVMATG